MPCFQDRLRSFFVNARVEDIFTIIMMLCIFALGYITYVIPPDELIISPVFKTRTELFLTMNIGMFALLKGYSSILQLHDNRKRNKISDLRNELEKAYGPLYSLFNPDYWDAYGYESPEGIVNVENINLNKSEKEKLNFILSNYPFMFKPEIFTHWREHLQYQHMEDDSDNRMFFIRGEFINMIYDEYHQRLEEYNNLLGKKSARAQRENEG